MMVISKVITACACSLTVAATVCAQTNEQKTASAAETQQSAPHFDFLVRLVNIQGSCEVNNPDTKQFVPAQNNKAYPLGTVVRTGAGSSVSLLFSAQESVQILEKTETSFAAAVSNANARVIRLVSGKIKTNFRDNLPEGSFCIETANTVCKNVAGRADFSLSTEANYESFQVATITGVSLIQGPQFRIPALRAANTINIQTALDRSLTRLTSVSGDFSIQLENGTDTPVAYGMSPKAVVKIWREKAAVGGRLIISTLVVSPTGKAHHRFAYADGRADLATGELISAQEVEEKEKADLPVLLTTKDASKTETASEKDPKKDAAQQ